MSLAAWWTMIKSKECALIAPSAAMFGLQRLRKMNGTLWSGNKSTNRSLPSRKSSMMRRKRQHSCKRSSMRRSQRQSSCKSNWLIMKKKLIKWNSSWISKDSKGFSFSWLMIILELAAQSSETESLFSSLLIFKTLRNNTCYYWQNYCYTLTLTNNFVNVCFQV